MKYERFDEIEINDNNYIVLNIITYNDNIYLYLINKDEFKKDVSLVKVVDNVSFEELVPIEDDEEFETILNMLLLENRDTITDIFNSENN